MKPIRTLAGYYKPHRFLFFVDITCAFIYALCDLVYPYIARIIINGVSDHTVTIKMIIVCAAVLIGIYILKAILNYCYDYWGHVLGTRIQGDMRRDLFAHLQKLPFPYYDENKTGVIMSRIVNDLFEVSELAHHAPEDIFLSLITLLGSFIILMTINVPLTLIIFCVIPPIVFFAAKIRLRMNDVFSESRKKTADINASVETAVSGIRVTRSYTADAYEEEKFGRANENFKKVSYAKYKTMAWFFCITGFSSDILYLLAITAGGIFFCTGQINAGEFASYLLYIALFLNPIKKLISLFEQLQNGLTGLNRFCEIMSVKPETDCENAEELINPKGHIVFDDVSFSYSTDESEYDSVPVISHLSIDIPKGKRIALVGPSGVGKTTLCHLIPRFYEINSGMITIDGKDITKLTRRSLRQAIGIVEQDVFLFDGTIKENIAYGSSDVSDEQIIDAAKKSGIHDYISTLEDGYETQVGERGVKLSGGQKQRISIARVFLKNPAILILDEATSALDNASEMLVQKSLEKLSEDRTSIIVAHRLSTVKNADEIIVLTDNGVAERGSHEELLCKNGLYSELYSYQFKQ